MKGKFSNGSWRTVSMTDGSSFIVNGKGKGKLLAKVCSNSEEMNDANARLIAAAPDMLVALTYLVEAIETVSLLTTAISDSIRLKDAKAVIKNVVGE